MSAELLFFYFTIGLAILVYWAIWTQPFGSGWLPVPKAEMKRGLEKAKVRKKDVLFDLGCGDGRVIIEASKTCKFATGFEMDPVRYLISKIRTRGNPKTEVIRGNFFKWNLKDANVIFAYLHPKTNKHLAAKIKLECKRGTRVVSYWWKMPGLKQVWKDEKKRVFVYRV